MREEQYSTAAIRRKTIFSFLVFFILITAAIIGFSRLYNAKPLASDPYIRPPLRSVANANESIFSSAFSPHHLAKTFPLSAAAKKVRVNGKDGLTGTADTSTWRLRVARAPGDTLLLTLNDIRALPRTDIVFDFKCIEGWSQVTHWGGVKFTDFIKHYGLDAQTAARYVGLETPDHGYYVGIDRESALHPQTILCYEMNGEPLPQNQGYPLRLIIPVKYGIKHLKRIGTIFFSDARPRDFWAEQGYDYYSGL